MATIPPNFGKGGAHLNAGGTGKPTLKTILESLNGQVAPQAAPPTVTSGAIDPTLPATKLSVTGTQAYTLADGTEEGQRVKIYCIVAATTPVGTLTPTTLADFTSILFDAVGESVDLEWHATGGWHIVGGSGATPS